jgi:nucleotide-binding universal stress UspA family protein
LEVEMGVVVVGVDWSDQAMEAVRWAAHEAELRHAELLIVHGWVPPYVAADFTGLAVGACEEPGHALLVKAEAEATRVAPGIDIRTRLVPAAGTIALDDASQGADLVVVGSRGRSALAEDVLGSVSRHVVHHAGCPVVVIRRPHDAEARRAS